MAPAPSARSDFFSAAPADFFRRITTAFSRSPPASSSAFRHCMMETPVLSRSSLTASVVISIDQKSIRYRPSPLLCLLSVEVCVCKFTNKERNRFVRGVIRDDGILRVLKIAVGTHDGDDRNA